MQCSLSPLHAACMSMDIGPSTRARAVSQWLHLWRKLVLPYPGAISFPQLHKYRVLMNLSSIKIFVLISLEYSSMHFSFIFKRNHAGFPSSNSRSWSADSDVRRCELDRTSHSSHSEGLRSRLHFRTTEEDVRGRKAVCRPDTQSECLMVLWVWITFSCTYWCNCSSDYFIHFPLWTLYGKGRWNYLFIPLNFERPVLWPASKTWAIA